MKFSKLSKILIVVLLVSVQAISLIACSTSKNNKDEKQSIDSSISTLMATEPNSADEASKLYYQLMEKENEILSTDKALWEKVFMASNKDNPMIEDGTNYGDFLLQTIEGAKDQFTDEEYKKLVAGAEQIKEIEGKLTILEQKYPECANAPSNGDSVPADSNGVISNGGGATSFPSFDGKDLDGNDIKSSDFFKSNNVTVVNYWFSTCKPCVGELPELEALNKKLAEKGGQVVGINTFTIDGDRTAIGLIQTAMQASPHQAFSLTQQHMLSTRTATLQASQSLVQSLKKIKQRHLKNSQTRLYRSNKNKA